MEVSKIIRMLHPYEKEVLPHIAEHNTLSGLAVNSSLKEVEVMRALEWLENKQLIKTEKVSKQLVLLGANGLAYLKKGLPERRVLHSIKTKSLGLSEIKKSADLTDEEMNVALGFLRINGLVSIRKDKELILTITKDGISFLSSKSKEESFIEQKFPIDLVSATVDKNILNTLLKRKDIIYLKEEKDKTISITELGRNVLKQKLFSESFVGSITPQMLQKGTWADKQFRVYDVAINVPSVTVGKKHIVTQALEYIKRIWLEMGFKEMNGRMIETSFWNLDTLFVPQDHPARDMQDTFYISDTGKESLPLISKKVKNVHENGGNTGSKGWGYKWSEAEAKKLLLRTHTTVLSAKTIANLKESQLPAKFFSLGKVFRNEALDWKHLFEFYQVEGIVIDPSANLKHLKGYLREFYKKMGYPNVRIRPAHFPYTEPSCEVEVFHPIKKEWLELGGAGIFRPEVVVPLFGKDIPVLAWGLGLERIISSYYKITDIRELYKGDLKMLQEARLWVR